MHVVSVLGHAVSHGKSRNFVTS